jgi:hypothetical protein
LMQGYNEQYGVWAWARKGITDAAGDSLSGRYHGPVQAGLHALACYMEEGVYAQLVKDQSACAANCLSQPCCLTQQKSTDDFVYDPSNKVAFNGFTFNYSNGTITGPVNTDAAFSTTGYSREDVLTHTLIHEIVHALLTANPDNRDHCENPCCPMYTNDARQRGWTETDLGATSCSITFKDGHTMEASNLPTCTHGQNGSNDITKYGVVWNVSH